MPLSGQNSGGLTTNKPVVDYSYEPIYENQFPKSTTPAAAAGIPPKKPNLPEPVYGNLPPKTTAYSAIVDGAEALRLLQEVKYSSSESTLFIYFYTYIF